MIFTKEVEESGAFYHINKEISVIVVCERKKEKSQVFFPSCMRIFLIMSTLVLKDILGLAFILLSSVAGNVFDKTLHTS